MSEHRVRVYKKFPPPKKERQVEEYILGYSSSIPEFFDKSRDEHGLGELLSSESGVHVFENGRIVIDSARNFE